MVQGTAVTFEPLLKVNYEICPWLLEASFALCLLFRRAGGLGDK